MAYIFVRTLPNCVPVTSGGQIHYCVLEFVIYKSEAMPGKESKITDFKETESIKKGPRIVISGQTLSTQKPHSEAAFCMSEDIPAAGYSFTAPDGWGCSHTYDSNTGQLSFILNAPVGGGSSFTAASIKINSFFTTAQEGVCTLKVSVENFSQYVPDITDSTYTIPLSKKYNLEILNFTANGHKGKFYLNHNLPVMLHWDVVCDLDTPLQLLADHVFHSALQQFTGEKEIAAREAGNHEYTLKMILPGGEKTENIAIKDTKWREIGGVKGISPDFTKQNRLFTFEHMILTFYNSKVYKASLGKDYVLSEWSVLCSYNGEVKYTDHVIPAVCGNTLYLSGGTKANSNELFYSAYDLKDESKTWVDYKAGQFSEMSEGALAGDSLDSGEPWLVYGKQLGDTILFMEYRVDRKVFYATLSLDFQGLKYFSLEMREGVLYLAAATGQEIVIMTKEHPDIDFCKTGRIQAVPVWMQWIRGNNGMFLLTDKGLYREKDWVNTEDFHPPYSKGSYPWCGGCDGKILSLISGEDLTDTSVAWATDIL